MPIIRILVYTIYIIHIPIIPVYNIDVKIMLINFELCGCLNSFFK